VGSVSWALLVTLVVVLGLSLFATVHRRRELERMGESLGERRLAERSGSKEAQLQHPVVDLSRCLGCATCVAACPEDGVLDLVHGQAMVVNGARCVGVAACERECPVGAITVTIANLEEREDVPALGPNLEAIGSPGLFLAGEVTAQARIKTAIEHGTFVADEVARRPRVRSLVPIEEPLDLLVVGAGPAGLACLLQARAHGLSVLAVDQERQVGGTVAKYPRRKLVLTEPVDVPHAGRLERRSYSKEELIGLWQGIALKEALPIQGGATFQGLERDGQGLYRVHTSAGTYVAHNVCLAIGRRGSPRRLGVPGEDLPKVTYALLDAHGYAGRRALVVGGGDSAVEAALALAEQEGTEVTLSYRKESFVRVRARNEARLQQAVAEGRLRVLLHSNLLSIEPGVVHLAVEDAGGSRMLALKNDDVFAMVGGTPPIHLLQRAGVSFDRRLRGPAARVTERGTGIVRALGIGFALAFATLVWALLHGDYYALPRAVRPEHAAHHDLAPARGLGLAFGVLGSVLIGVNLLYLARRAPGSRLRWGSLSAWMTSHVATGILAFLCVLLHSAMAPRDTVGGHAFWALAVLLVTGAVGRYLYSYVPRAANGRELELEEAKRELEALPAGEGDARRFHERACRDVFALADATQWSHSFPRRLLALLGVQFGLRRLMREIQRRGREEGVSERIVHDTVELARVAHRRALMVAHYEDLRALSSTWRWLHRWVAALLVLLVVVHVTAALVYDVHAPEVSR